MTLPPATIETCEGIGLLSTGGMGPIHRARHVGLGRVVALEATHATERDEIGHARFPREIDIRVTPSHTHLVRRIDGGSQGDI